MRYVLVTGGVVSGLGKGVTASSIGVVLKACGLRVTSIKIGLHLLNLSCLLRSFPNPEPWLMLVVWSFTFRCCFVLTGISRGSLCCLIISLKALVF